MLGNLFGKIMGFILIIVTLALSPSIVTTNVAISGHASVANMTGMAVLSTFGAPLIIFGLLIAGGIFAVVGVKGGMNASAGDLMKVVGEVIVAIVSLTFMATIMTYVELLIDVAGGGFAQVIYSIIPIVLYIGIITMTGWGTVSAYRKAHG